MATGSILVFDEAKAKMLDGDWAASDLFHLAIFESARAPAVGDAAPVYSATNEVTAAGTYTAGGISIGALSALVTEAGGVMTFDSLESDPTWAQDASNTTTAYWGIIYNFTDAGKDAVAFVELGGPVDMAAGALTVAWPAGGIFTIT